MFWDTLLLTEDSDNMRKTEYRGKSKGNNEKVILKVSRVALMGKEKRSDSRYNGEVT